MMPRGLLMVAGAMVVFAAVVLGVLAWAGLSGSAGSQRGLVIFNETSTMITVVFENGARGDITPDDERTFVVKRDEFPSEITVWDDDAVLHTRRFEYEEFAEADFRISFDERGFYATSTYRDTPVPSPEQRD